MMYESDARATEPDFPPVLVYTVTPADDGERLDVFLSRVSPYSRSAVAALIEEGRVERIPAGKTVTKKDKLRTGDTLRLTVPSPEPIEALPEEIPLDIRYEDADIVVVNKPKGMVVHPAPGNPSGTLVNALLYHCRDSLSGIGGAIRPGIVHRIDKDTSGLLVVAKNDFAHLALAEQIKVHSAARVYRAIAIGGFGEDAGTVDLPIGRHRTDRKRMAVYPHGDPSARAAVTHYTVDRRYLHKGERFSLLTCRLETGRTHQIRVHMAAKGHPLLGDPVYGGDRTRFEARHPALFLGQTLHASELTLTHPRTGERLHITAPLPERFTALLALLSEGEE